MIRINLAPTGTRPRRGLRLRIPAPTLGLAFLVAYAVAVGGLGWWWWRLTGEAERLRAEIARASEELATLKAATAQTDQVRALVAELKQRLTTVTELTQHQARPIRLLDAFADTVPPDLWITGLEEKAQVLKVSGAAFSTTAVADFMANLRRSGRFKEVDIVVARQDLSKTPRLVTFEVTCRFEG